MKTRDEYVKQMKEQLDSLNAHVGDLESKAKEVTDDAREKYAVQLTQIDKAYQATHDKLEEIKAASGDKWEAMVEDTDKVHKAFVHSVNYFKSQLK
jgi:vacuolar-type H+-ATPase subunit I/STV1